MFALQPPDWAAVFVPDGSILESFLRGTVVYFAVFVLFRLILRRQTGGLGLSDVMIAVLTSECVSQSLTAQLNSVPNGLAALTALLFWSYVLDLATDRWAWLNRLLELPPVELVRDGRPRPAALHAQHITDDELMSQLRLNGVDDLARVKVATLEPEGSISVVTRDPPEPEGRTGDVSRRLAQHPATDVAGSPGEGDPPDLDAALKRFLAAAGDVQTVAWQDERAAAAARAALARHGVRPRTRPTSPAPETPA